MLSIVFYSTVLFSTASVIEDNENNLELIRFILEQAHYKTRFAMTGLEGVHKTWRGELKAAS